MKKGVLITLPASDDVTEYLSAFSKEVVDFCTNNQIPMTQLVKNNVTKIKFESLLESYDYKMIFFNGHGSESSIMGHNNEELVSINKNHSLLKNRITYARSCWATMKLGIKVIGSDKKGCFIGYKIPFMFIIDKTRITNPLKDNAAKIFFKTANLVPLGIIKGKTARESNENSKRSMLKHINKALRKGDKDSQAIAQTLWNNYIGQEIIGNPNERLF